MLAERCAGYPPLARRMIALGVAPLIVVLALVVMCSPLIAARHAQDGWREEARELLARAKNAATDIVELDRQNAAMRASPLWPKLYQRGGTPTPAMLQADIGAVLGSVQVSAQSITPIAAQESQFFIKTGARVTASMRVNQLRELLTAFASHPRYLRVERLTVDAPHAQVETDNPPLAVVAEIYGYELRAPPQKVH